MSITRRPAAYCSLLLASIIAGPAPASGGEPVSRPKVENTLLSESFEESWPKAPWRVSHPQDAADVDWGRTDFRASHGSHSIRCAGAGPEAPEAGGPAPARTSSWVIAGPYDLSDARSGALTFDLWLSTELFDDQFMWLVSTDGEHFSGQATSTDTVGWRSIAADLTSWGAAGDVTGHSRVWIAFVYRSDHSNLYEGAYIDNVVLVADDGVEVSQGYTYTTDADFELGTSVGLEADSDSLRLSGEWSALPYLWVPNSGSGTVSKVDSETGSELARYRTGPDRELVPSPAAVDLNGDCWVGNRSAGTVVKIGLEESGHCVDRNGNGRVDTSRDANGDANITDNEILAWGADECVLFEISLVQNQEGSHTPGDAHDSYAANNLQAIAVSAENDVWAGVADSRVLYRLDGGTGEILETLPLADEEVEYLALAIDRNGGLWSSLWPAAEVVRFGPSDGDITSLELSHGSLGLALSGEDLLYVTGYTASALSRVDVSEVEVVGTGDAWWQSQGAAATSDGDVWVAAPGSGVVSRFSPDGALEATIPLANRPSAVAVDQAGKVWVVGQGFNMIYRLNPETNAVELQKDLLAAYGHDAVGDLTGIVARSITTRIGTWSVIHDSAADMTPWGTVSWAGVESDGAEISVRTRSSNDRTSWSSWVEVTNGDPLDSVPAGRYLQVDVSLRSRKADAEPVLDEVTVEPSAVPPQPPDASFTWTPTDPVVGQQVGFTDTSSGSAPSSWAWDFGDGGSSDQQNPVHVYTTPGSHTVTLTVKSEGGSDTASYAVTVNRRGLHRGQVNRLPRPMRR